jgi:hypothetical protein
MKSSPLVVLVFTWTLSSACAAPQRPPITEKASDAEGILARSRFSAAPAQKPRLLPEWELDGGIILPYLPASTSPTIFWDILPIAAGYGRVIVLVPDYAVREGLVQELDKRRLSGLLPNLEILTWAPDTIWAREYGPLFARDGATPLILDPLYCPVPVGDFAYLERCLKVLELGDQEDPQDAADSVKSMQQVLKQLKAALAADNQDSGSVLSRLKDALSGLPDSTQSRADVFPYVLAQQLGVRWLRPPVVLEGGQLQVDGRGTCFISRGVLAQNGQSEAGLHEQLQMFFGCRQSVYVNDLPGEVKTRLETIFRVVRDDLYLLSELRPIAQPTDARGYRQEQLRKALDRIAAHLKAARPGARIVRVPIPDVVVDANGELHIPFSLGYVKVGRAIFLPSYSWSLDRFTEAMRTLRQVYPDAEIFPVDADPFLSVNASPSMSVINIPAGLLSRRVAALPTRVARPQANPGSVPLPVHKRVAVELPAGAPRIGAREPLVQLIFRATPSTENARLLMHWARTLAIAPDEIQLAVVPRRVSASSDEQLIADSLLAAQEQGRFFAAWDALLQPWPDGQAQKPQRLSDLYRLLFSAGLDAVALERALDEGRQKDRYTALQALAPEADAIFLNGIPLSLQTAQHVVEAWVRRELELARRLRSDGVARKDVQRRLLAATPKRTEQRYRTDDKLLLGEPGGRLHITFFHDYESPASRELAQALMELLPKIRRGLEVEVRCVAHDYHPQSGRACEALYEADDRGAFPLLHERFLNMPLPLSSRALEEAVASLQEEGVDSGGVLSGMARQSHQSIIDKNAEALRGQASAAVPWVVLSGGGAAARTFGYESRAELLGYLRSLEGGL